MKPADPAEGAITKSPTPSDSRRTARNQGRKVFAIADAIVESPLIAYPAIVALQLRLVWDLWRYKDVTYGDTSSYYVDAANWSHTLHDNIVWSPLYTAYFGTFAFFIKNVPSAVAAHRLTIILAATVLVLMLMRALLGPALGLLIAVWWTVLPPNFNVEYEVHLFALLPVLIAAIVAVRWSGRRSRGVVLAILVGTTLLLRNELLIASVIVASAIIVSELREFRRGSRAPMRAYLRAYALPLALVLLLIAVAYARSSVQGGQAMAALRAKQGLNLCQTYAYGYQQQNPSRFKASPWTDCGALTKVTFGSPLPSFFEALRSNPGAMARFVRWNAHLLPNGLQVALYGAMSSRDDPGYFPVKSNRTYAFLLSLTTLLVTFTGAALLRGQRTYWLSEWLPARRWSVVVLVAVSFTALVVALTQRPRPEYLYGLTIALMAFVGLCVAAVIRQVGRFESVSPIAIALALALAIAMGSYYHPGPRPLHDAIDRLSIVQKSLQRPGSVLVASGNYPVCAYLAATPTRECTLAGWANLREQIVSRRSLADVLNEAGASAIYVDPQLRSDPTIAPLLARPGEFGWRVIASGDAAQGQWDVLVPTATTPVERRGGVLTALNNIPADLSKPGISYSGIYKDGWSQRIATVVLAGGPQGRLTVRAQVLRSPRGTHRLEISVNSHRAALKSVHAGPLNLSVPVPASRRARRIRLQWSFTASIGSRDPRKAAALLEYVGVTTATAPSSVRFPGGFNTPGLRPSGVFPDGWVTQNARFTLAGGRGGDLILRADVPTVDSQRLVIRVNGLLVISTQITREPLELRESIPPSRTPRTVELDWSGIKTIAPNDPRMAAARLEYVAIDAHLHPLRGPVAAPMKRTLGFEHSMNEWTKIDTSKQSLKGTLVSTSQTLGSHSLRLTDTSRGQEDYYVTVIKRLVPNTKYDISASSYIPSFAGPATENRGLFAIARTGDPQSGGSYDAPTQTSADITSSTRGWARKSISVKMGATDNQIELRLYAPDGTTYWRTVGIRNRVRASHSTSTGFIASLSARHEAPLPIGAGSRTTGTFAATLTGRTLKWRLTISGLTGQPIAGDIYSGATGVVGARLILLCEPCATGTTGEVVLSASQLRDLVHGPVYLNVGTAANPAGEIRGQITRKTPD